MEIGEISACIQALKQSNNGVMSTEVISAFIQSLQQSNEEKVAKKRRSKKPSPPPQESAGVIDVYKRPLTAQEAQDEIDALTWERPTFKVPGLDEVLRGIEKEAQQYVDIFKL